MTTVFSTFLSTNLWTASLSVLAIMAIIIGGGFVVSLVGRMVLSLFEGSGSNSSSKGKSKQNSLQGEYQMLSEEKAKQAEVIAKPEQDFLYTPIDQELAKKEEQDLKTELAQDVEVEATKSSAVKDDFFDDITNDDLEDDDIMGMIDEISNEVLDDENQPVEEEKSVLDKYSIDTFFDNLEEEEIEEDVTDINLKDIVDFATMQQFEILKQQVKEIVNSMDQKSGKTFNEQLIDILNELRVANNKDKIITKEDAEREIIALKQELQTVRAEMEKQVEEKMAAKDAEIKEKIDGQLAHSKVEIESLRNQLTELLVKLGESDEGAKPIEDADIEAIRNEVKDMLDEMRNETVVHNNQLNEQLLAILTEMKEVALKKGEQAKVETAEQAVEEVAEWQNELELSKLEMEKQFKEQMAYTDEQMKAELQAQMEEYNTQIADLKEQMSALINEFKQESESSKVENQALIDELENERQARIKLEQEKLQAEQEQLTQIESLRKENEKLADMLQERESDIYQPLTEDEIKDLYSERTEIDYSAIKQMYDEQIDSKVQEGFEQSKAEIDALKEQVSRLTAFMEEREGTMAEQINVHEIRTADFDLENAKEINIKEVEERVNAKIAEYVAEVEMLNSRLDEMKEEVENRYKEQLADTQIEMEYDTIGELQVSAEQINTIQRDLEDIKEGLIKEQENVAETSKECMETLENARESKEENAKQQLEEAELTIVGPKHNQVALVATDTIDEQVENIDIETVKELTQAEIDELVEAKLENSNNEIKSLREQVEKLQEVIAIKEEELSEVQATISSIPAVRSPLFDIEAIKKITAQEVEEKVQERLAEAMKEIEELRKQLEISKQEIEQEYKQSVRNEAEEVKDKLKDSAAEVLELKEQLDDLSEQIELEHQEAKKNSEEIAEQLELVRKEKEEATKQQLLELDNSNQELPLVTPETNVTVIGPKNNQIALITTNVALSETVIEDNLPTIDIETVKKLTEQEIEENVEQRMTSSTIEIEELRKQILALSLQIKEIKDNSGSDEGDSKPIVFHYSTEEAYLERLNVLEERLKVAKKDFKINNRELRPLEKVSKTLERDKAKLRRKEAIVAKKKVALYGVNNYVDIDEERAQKLAQELELLDGLRLSVSHCEEVMSANIDRYPILVRTNQILKNNIANIESDIETLNRELNALRDKNNK